MGVPLDFWVQHNDAQLSTSVMTQVTSSSCFHFWYRRRCFFLLAAICLDRKFGCSTGSKLMHCIFFPSEKVEHARAGIDVLSAAQSTIANLRENFVLIDKYVMTFYQVASFHLVSRLFVVWSWVKVVFP